MPVFSTRSRSDRARTGGSRRPARVHLLPGTALALTAAVLTTGCGLAESDSDRIAGAAAAASSAPPSAPSASTTPHDAARTPSGTPAAPATSATPPPARMLTDAARRVRPTLAPENGETVGVGQPVSLVFPHQKVDPALRAGIEGRLRISTSTGVTGAWHWAEAKGATHLHFRPREFWPRGTRVELDARLDGVRLDDRTAAVGDRRLRFTIGDAMVSTVDLSAHTMTVVRNGRTLRTIPVSGGEERFRTRDGIKTVLSKDGTVLMDSLTIGIPRTSPDGFYDRYRWSMRETVSGEYVHAAPDNAEAFGKRNVSHGCIGMSEADAEWLYRLSRKGDVIKAVGSSGKPMDRFGNGYGDWNISWSEWVRGSALGELPT
ncbi:L,D-transpeptidase [Streptomyces sp. NPDC097619]|uniref:L,D-transpeptidase n=1 Tax=Streptomyces sp. NPDC097619 TaxID=3157228 RepID=UPI00331C74B9